MDWNQYQLHVIFFTPIFSSANAEMKLCGYLSACKENLVWHCQAFCWLVSVDDWFYVFKQEPVVDHYVDTEKFEVVMRGKSMKCNLEKSPSIFSKGSSLKLACICLITASLHNIHLVKPTANIDCLASTVTMVSFTTVRFMAKIINSLYIFYYMFDTYSSSCI